MVEKEFLKSIFEGNEWFVHITSTVLGVVIGFLLKIYYDKNNHKIQKMKCWQTIEDVQSKLQISIENRIYNNVYFKEYKLENTTNMDIEYFKLIFTFDDSATIIECSSDSKEYSNYQKIYVDKKAKNRATAIVKNFNRKETISYKFKIGNITSNACKITETGAVGFKVKMKKRKNNSKYNYLPFLVN